MPNTKSKFENTPIYVVEFTSVNSGYLGMSMSIYLGIIFQLISV